jgi:hypothetical protein
MKTNQFHITFLAGAALALGTGLAIPTAIAGPGLEYWRNQGKTEVKTAATAAPVERATRGCIDARLVTVTETKPSWHNGRGPLVTTEVGKKLECTSCDTPMVVMKPSGHNGRGGMVPVEIRGKHDCGTSGCGTPVTNTN